MASSIALPGLLQRLFGYDAYGSGLAMSPSGVTSMAAMVLVGVLMGRSSMPAGWSPSAWWSWRPASYWMAPMNLEISPWPVGLPADGADPRAGAVVLPDQRGRVQVHPRAPARGGRRHCQPAAHRRGERRHVAGQTIESGGSSSTCPALGEWLSPLNPTSSTFLEQAREFFLQQTGDPARSQQMAMQQLDDLRQQQAMSLAYFDVFWLCAVVSLA